MGRQEKYKHKKFSLPFGLLSPALCTLCLHFIHRKTSPLTVGSQKKQGEIGIYMIYVKCSLGLSFDCSR